MLWLSRSHSNDVGHIHNKVGVKTNHATSLLQCFNAFGILKMADLHNKTLVFNIKKKPL